MGKDKIIYSTNPDFHENCPDCENPVDECVCNSEGASNSPRGVVYIKREVKGRKGKSVTTISNIGGDVKNIQKDLQKLCGAGGTVKNGIIEIQGDHRNKIKDHLEKSGLQVKLSGG